MCTQNRVCWIVATARLDGDVPDHTDESVFGFAAEKRMLSLLWHRSVFASPDHTAVRTAGKTIGYDWNIYIVSGRPNP